MPRVNAKCMVEMDRELVARVEIMDSQASLNELIVTTKHVLLPHLRYLLDHKRYPVDKRDANGNTALHFLLMSALVRQPPSKSLYFGTKLLILAGANVFLKNRLQLRPLDILLQASPKYNKRWYDPVFAALTMLLMEKTLRPEHFGIRYDVTDLLRVLVLGSPRAKKVIINQFYLKAECNELHEFANLAVRKYQIPSEVAGFLFSFGPDLTHLKDLLQQLEKSAKFDFTKFFSFALDGKEETLDFVFRLLEHLRRFPLTFAGFEVYTQLTQAYIHGCEVRRRNYDPEFTEIFLGVLQRLRALDFLGANHLYASMVIPALKDILSSFIGAPKHCRVDSPEWVADKARHFRALLFYCGAKQARDAVATLRESFSAARVEHGEDLFRHYIQQFEDFFPIGDVQDIINKWRVTPGPPRLRELCREKLRKTIEEAMAPRMDNDDDFIRRLKALGIPVPVEKFLRYVDLTPHKPGSFELPRNMRGIAPWTEGGSNRTFSVYSLDWITVVENYKPPDDLELESNIMEVSVWEEPDLDKVTLTTR